ncbi:MAG: methionine--tRNA ligase subunit beta [Deltaproteobacteria bacterium]|nr:MAG: methionine--tRNA ligase subunit beta [Deltaproteobacteria bacterium]
MVSFDDFARLDIRIGTIRSADRVQGTDKLMRLELDVGGEMRQVVAGIAPHYTAQQLVGKQVPVLVNLEPRKLRGVESQGMILAVDVEGRAILLTPEGQVPPGSKVR